MRYSAARVTHSLLGGTSTIYLVVDAEGSDGTTVMPTVVARARTLASAEGIADALNATPDQGV